MQIDKEILVLLIVLICTIFIFFGILCVKKSTAERLIRFRNRLNGTQTKITNASLIASKIGGIALIIFSLVVMLIFLLQVY